MSVCTEDLFFLLSYVLPKDKGPGNIDVKTDFKAKKKCLRNDLINEANDISPLVGIIYLFNEKTYFQCLVKF